MIKLQDGAYLRKLRPEDVTAEYVDGLNDAEVHRFLPTPRKQRQTAASIANYISAQQGNAYMFGLFVSGRLRATVRLHDFSDEKVTIGIAIFDKSVWGVGWGQRCIRAMIDYADRLGVKTIIAGIEKENEKSRCAFAACGFIEQPDHYTWLLEVPRFSASRPRP